MRNDDDMGRRKKRRDHMATIKAALNITRIGLKLKRIKSRYNVNMLTV